MCTTVWWNLLNALSESFEQNDSTSVTSGNSSGIKSLSSIQWHISPSTFAVTFLYHLCRFKSLTQIIMVWLNVCLITIWKPISEPLVYLHAGPKQPLCGFTGISFIGSTISMGRRRKWSSLRTKLPSSHTDESIRLQWKHAEVCHFHDHLPYSVGVSFHLLSTASDGSVQEAGRTRSKIHTGQASWIFLAPSGCVL